MKGKSLGRRIGALLLAGLTMISMVELPSKPQAVWAAETRLYENAAAKTTERLTPADEDWSDAKPIISYDESVTGVAVSENFTMQADVLLDAEAYNSLAEEGDYLKLQGVVKTGADWTWQDSQNIPYLQQSDFAVEGDGYKTSVTIAFEDKTPGELKGIYYVVVAKGFSGVITVSNVRISETIADTPVQTQETAVYTGTERQNMPVDFSALSAENWDTLPMMTYATNISGVTLEKNVVVRGTVTIDEALYQSLQTEGNYVKLQSVTKNGADWAWTQGADYPYLDKNSFSQGNYSTNFEVRYTDIDGGELHEIIFRAVGIGAQGTVTISNVSISNVVTQEEVLPQKDPAVLDDFEEYGLGDAAGWTKEEGWQYANDVLTAVEHVYGSNMLKVSLNYTGCENYNWSEAKIHKSFGNGVDVSAYNQLQFDMIYPAALDGFKIKVFATQASDAATIIEKEGSIIASDYAGGMKKATVTIKFTPKSANLTDATIGIVGVNTGFVGDIYIDNIILAQYDETADFTDITSVPGAGTQADLAGMPYQVSLADEEATPATRALYAYLMGMDAADQVVFGHQNDTHKSVRPNVGSDTKDITGSISGIVGIDSLALTGVELGITDVDAAIEESVRIGKEAAAQGAILTLSTHMPNMSNAKIVATPGAARPYDFSNCDFMEAKDLSNNCAAQVLPGGAYNAQFTAYLDIIADYAKGLGDIPVLFRPFHENSGGWFWWGAATTDIETYNALFRYTEDYLTSVGVHNFIYVYSPNGPISSRETYLERYPGDDYVDILAFDYYDDYNSYPAEYSPAFIDNLRQTCQIVKGIAKEKGKVAAIAETGVRVMKADGSDIEGLLVKDNPIRGQNWYRQVNNVAKECGMSYFLLWANFSDTNFYVPYKYNDTKGQELVNEFIDFYNEDSSVFANGTCFYGNASMKDVAGIKRGNAAGYFTNLFPKAVLKQETTLRANVRNAKDVSYVLENPAAGAVQKISAIQTGNGSYEGTVTAAQLAELGSTDVGTVSLVADGKTLVVLNFISFGKDKDTLDFNMVENFELYYGDDAYLNGTFTENSAAGCSSSFRLDERNKASGSYGGAFCYHLKTNGPEVWTGRMKGLEHNDYSAYNAITMWVKPDGYGQKLVVQLVSGGEDFEVYLTDFAATTEAKYVTIPFDQLKGKANGTFDPSNVTKFAIWCNSVIPEGQKGVDIESAIVFDEIQFVNVDESTLDVRNGYALTDTSVVPEETQTTETPEESQKQPEDNADNGGEGASKEENQSGNAVSGDAWATTETTRKTRRGIVYRKLSNGSVSIEGREEILPAGTRIRIDSVVDEQTMQRAAKAVATYLKSAANYRVYEISLRDAGGNEIHQLNGMVTVTMPVPDGFRTDHRKTVVVYRLNEDGTLTKCKTTVKDGMVSFQTDHFSTYLLVEETVGMSPETSENTAGVILALCILLVCGAGAFRIYGRRKCC